ncbi:DEAD/DEAH box helicase family protein [Isoptericola sp. b441]|uniref:DEAD/DEAH box helicase family protein n=1 Tax=Actinotalea lenta TaxID=3064654 RepID=A0ABT9D8I8_9CELL|nr:type I restriction endonuclease [Isoptericola sp. b441]MDO8107210.1 DEAD/DEAH box helicase family protein [Isoptericola sp. b441]
MAKDSEKSFEDEFCAHLAAHGWLYSPNDDGYDAKRALFPTDLTAWLQETQPEAWAKAVKAAPGAPEHDKQVDRLLDQVVNFLDTDVDQGGGMLSLLRRPLRVLGSPKPISLCQFRPNNSLNPKVTAAFEAVRLRVMRQVHYSSVPGDERSIDLVFFINGLPVATAELKTDFKQSVGDAITQYKTTRLPVENGHAHPLLGFATRALVHFAVSNEEVYMTTQLAGDKTHFLPFNKGHGHGKGNPPREGESATAYLWTEVLERGTFLDIIGKFCHLEIKTVHDPISGTSSAKRTLLFPRYHQWDAVTKTVADVREYGPGRRYLIQHSAGSGKTNTIAWTAHQLSRLFDANDTKVFDKVIVVTDRTVLDDQLQAAVRQIDPSFRGDKDADSPVVTIDEKTVRAAGSKSKALDEALNSPKHIIVVTMQTFPYVLDVMSDLGTFAGKNFAVIADEAHSSQSGAAAGTLRQILSAAKIEHEEAEEGESEDFETQDVLAGLVNAKANTPNISFLAFTATPKAKTLEMFGTATEGGGRRAFHLYTMKQAIDEGFILDVLRGYQTYDTAFRISHEASEQDLVVDKQQATIQMLQWVHLHPTNIGGKVKIIVEHFNKNVAPLLGGYAKAMVVTGSRKEAVRFKTAMDDYITTRNYALKTLVAFSGKVLDEEVSPEPFTEASMNPATVGSNLADAFAGPTYQVMIVANKFQTGFDQPLLSAMYVNKRLSGVMAVQTLSRLNRTYRTPNGEPKTKTFVLDFVNDPEDIRKAFEPYYEDAYLEQGTDPMIVLKIAQKLEHAGIFATSDVNAAAEAYLAGKGNNVLSGIVKPARDEFFRRRDAAVLAGNQQEVDACDVFRRDTGTYVRVYDFMSQVFDYADPYLEALAIYLRMLAQVIAEDAQRQSIDLTGMELAVKHTKSARVDISLGKGDIDPLHGFTEAGTASAREKIMVAMQDVIDNINALFGADFQPSQTRGIVAMLLGALSENQALIEQAKSNSVDQFVDSPNLQAAILQTLLSNNDVHDKFTEFMVDSGLPQDKIIASIGRMLFVAVHESDQPLPQE